MAKSRRKLMKKTKTKTKNRRRRNLSRNYKLRGAGITDLWNSVTGKTPSVTSQTPSATGQPPSVTSQPPSVTGTTSTITSSSVTDLWNSGTNWFNNATSQTPSATDQTPSATDQTPSATSQPQVNSTINNPSYNTQNPFTQPMPGLQTNYQAPAISPTTSGSQDQMGPFGTPVYKVGGRKRMSKRRVTRGGQSLNYLKNQSRNLGYTANNMGSQFKYVVGNNPTDFRGLQSRSNQIYGKDNNGSNFNFPKDPTKGMYEDTTQAERSLEDQLITYLSNNPNLKLNRSEIKVGDIILVCTDNSHIYKVKVLTVDDNNGNNDNLQVMFLDCYKGRRRLVKGISNLLKKYDNNKNVYYRIPDITLPEFGTNESQNMQNVTNFYNGYISN